jgi:hypothetical protein
MEIGLEGGVLESDSCPGYMLVFKGPENDVCWQKIVSDYDHNGAGATTDFLVTVQGVVRGKRRSVLDFQKSERTSKDASRGPPRVTVEIERILNCTRK